MTLCFLRYFKVRVLGGSSWLRRYRVPCNMDLSASRNLSCQRCRARKIKCDRSEPCSTCARSGETCVYPSRRQSRTRKSRKADLEVLRSRVTQLEELLSDVTTHHSPTHTLDREIESSAVSGTTIPVSTPEVGDLISHGESIQYHSVYHWASACEKVCVSCNPSLQAIRKEY